MPDRDMTPADKELVRSLGKLAPAKANLDRDGVMFRAGQMSTRRGMWAWRSAAAVLVVALGVSIGVNAMHTPTESPADRVVYVQIPGAGQRSGGSAVQPVVVLAPVDEAELARRSEALAKYVELRTKVINGDLDAFPRVEVAAGSAGEDRAFKASMREYFPYQSRPRVDTNTLMQSFVKGIQRIGI